MECKETREEQKAGWLMNSQESISISSMAKTSEVVKINIIINLYIGCSYMTIGQRKTDANRGVQRSTAGNSDILLKRLRGRQLISTLSPSQETLEGIEGERWGMEGGKTLEGRKEMH